MFTHLHKTQIRMHRARRHCVLNNLQKSSTQCAPNRPHPQPLCAPFIQSVLGGIPLLPVLNPAIAVERRLAAAHTVRGSEAPGWEAAVCVWRASVYRCGDGGKAHKSRTIHHQASHLTPPRVIGPGQIGPNRPGGQYDGGKGCRLRWCQ